VDGGADFRVSPAAAEIAAHGFIDFLIGGIGDFLEQRDRAHDLSGLAVAALRDLFIEPSLLNGMQLAVLFEPLDGDNWSGNAADRIGAGADGLSIDEHGACTTHGDAAAEFWPGYASQIAQGPEQRHVGLGIEFEVFSVDVELDHRNLPDLQLTMWTDLLTICEKMSERQAMSFDTTTEAKEDPKRALIMASAMAVVLRYGYQRMTMDDIAKEAGISRPALYLVFKNKAEIYRAITEGVLGQALAKSAAELAGAGTLEERLYGALRASILDPMELLLASTHGAELLDMKHSMAGEMIHDWRIRQSALLAHAIDAGRVKERLLTSPQLADILLDGVEGLKQRTMDMNEIRTGVRALVRLVAQAAG
jgi:AcrR family transcriptional regulator